VPVTLASSAQTAVVRQRASREFTTSEQASSLSDFRGHPQQASLVHGESI